MGMRKKCVAILLAGGQGSRLRVLTKKLAKPAVPVGGNYRIIDFSLSNCANSRIDTVGVLTQYQPHLLHSYIGDGRPWGLDGVHGGVHLLPPFSRCDDVSWYKGTANAVYQNIGFLDRLSPENVLILSGDHVYKMDYAPMLDQHRESGADLTMAVHSVPLSDASRYGIVECDDGGHVTGFAEKPRSPVCTMASMGVYAFKWSVLRRILIEDEADRQSSGDFGGAIIPRLLQRSRQVYIYRFYGYWKDVGTIDSLWETNMDLISPKSGLDLFAADQRVFYRHTGMPPCYVDRSANVGESLIADGAKIYGDVTHSVISSGVTIGPGAEVLHSFIMPGAVVEEGAHIENAIIAENARIGRDAHVGGETDDGLVERGIAVVGEGRSVGERCYIPAGHVLENDLYAARIPSNAYAETYSMIPA